MTQKKLVISFMSIIIIILAPLPIINSLFIVSGLVDKSNFNKKFLFSTDNLESYINYFFYTNFKISLNKKDVIVGQDDFLFLGNGIGDVIDKTQGLYPYKQQDIDQWTNKLKDIQTWYEDRGIKFVIVIAPNKHSVYNEKLPAWIRQPKITLTDDVIKYSKDKNINLLDLRPSMKEKIETKIYYITDTHWNDKGASIAYNQTINYMNRIYNTRYKKIDYSFYETQRSSGDLARFLKINFLLPSDYEKDFRIRLKVESNVCHGLINKDKQLEKCVQKKNPIINVGTYDQYIINNSSINPNKVLLLCDSFAVANSKLYNETFNTIWRFHYQHINGKKLSNFVQKHKPDIVIYQIIERSLYNGLIVKEL